MSRRFLLLLLLGLLTADVGAGVGAASGAPDLSWLVGCWRSESGATREEWFAAGDGLMFGFSVLERDGRVVFFEQLRVERMESRWAYFAYPRGEGPVRFDLAAQSMDSATFENPGHDDPQVIRYERTGAGLRATVSLIDGAKERSWDYVPCQPE